MAPTRSVVAAALEIERRRVIPRSKVEADLLGLCAPGHSIGRAPGDITPFKNGGGGHLDLYTALFILKSLG